MYTKIYLIRTLGEEKKIRYSKILVTQSVKWNMASLQGTNSHELLL